MNAAEDSASRRGDEIGLTTGGGGGIVGETEGFISGDLSGDLSGVGCEACFAFLDCVVSSHNQQEDIPQC